MSTIIPLLLATLLLSSIAGCGSSPAKVEQTPDFEKRKQAAQDDERELKRLATFLASGKEAEATITTAIVIKKVKDEIRVPKTVPGYHYDRTIGEKVIPFETTKAYLIEECVYVVQGKTLRKVSDPVERTYERGDDARQPTTRQGIVTYLPDEPDKYFPGGLEDVRKRISTLKKNVNSF